ncbi:MAG: methylmalonyl-CoA epimerase [Gemmatimonadota bacterium]
MTPFDIDHVGVATPSITDTRSLYELLTGARCSEPEVLPAQGVTVAFIGKIELLQPLSPDSAVGRFLARRGPGLHHLAFRVDDIAASLAMLEAEGMRLIDREPRRGARGHQVAFVHPSSTGGVLWEIVQNATDP